MKIVVGVKRVIDPYVKIRIRADELGVETQHVKHSMNPFDAVALEAAVQLLEQGIAQEVLAVSIGPKDCQETLRQALALGASHALHIQTESPHGCLQIAQILQCVVHQEQPNAVFLGKQAIDNDSHQTAAMLSALLDWPQATAVSTLHCSSQQFTVACDADQGRYTFCMPLPAVVSVDLHLNQPRYITLPNLMKAKQKPLLSVQLAELPVPLTSPCTRILSVKAPEPRSKGIQLHSVDALLHTLRYDAKVLNG